MEGYNGTWIKLTGTAGVLDRFFVKAGEDLTQALLKVIVERGWVLQPDDTIRFEESWSEGADDWAVD